MYNNALGQTAEEEDVKVRYTRKKNKADDNEENFSDQRKDKKIIERSIECVINLIENKL